MYLKTESLGIIGAVVIQAGCPSCHPTNAVKAVKRTSRNYHQQRQRV